MPFSNNDVWLSSIIDKYLKIISQGDFEKLSMLLVEFIMPIHFFLGTKERKTESLGLQPPQVNLWLPMELVNSDNPEEP